MAIFQVKKHILNETTFYYKKIAASIKLLQLIFTYPQYRT